MESNFAGINPVSTYKSLFLEICIITFFVFLIEFFTISQRPSGHEYEEHLLTSKVAVQLGNLPSYQSFKLITVRKNKASVLGNFAAVVFIQAKSSLLAGQRYVP